MTERKKQRATRARCFFLLTPRPQAAAQCQSIQLPRPEQVVRNTDDGVAYEEMMKVLDMSREIGYPKTLLAGGPPSATPDGAPPAPPAGG